MIIYNIYINYILYFIIITSYYLYSTGTVGSSCVI